MKLRTKLVGGAVAIFMVTLGIVALGKILAIALPALSWSLLIGGVLYIAGVYIAGVIAGFAIGKRVYRMHATGGTIPPRPDPDDDTVHVVVLPSGQEVG